MISKRVRIMVRADADGTSSSFTLDLWNDPYWVGEEAVQGYGGQVVNWFTTRPPVEGERPEGEPTAVDVISGADSATLKGSVVTINVPVAPEGTLYQITLDLLFGSEIT